MSIKILGNYVLRMCPDEKEAPNLTGRAGKPIILPPTTFEDAVEKMLNTPAPKEDKAKKKTAKKRRA